MFQRAMMSASGDINPVFVSASEYNTNVSGQSQTLVSGKTYAAVWNTDSNTATLTLTNATKLYEHTDNGTIWGQVPIYCRIVVFRADSSTVSFTSSTRRCYGLLITMLD